MLCAPRNRPWPFSYHTKMTDFLDFFCPFSREKNCHKLRKSVMNIASSDSQIDIKPQRGRPKRAALPDVNINMRAQRINSERASLTSVMSQLDNCCNYHVVTSDDWLIFVYMLRHCRRLGGRYLSNDFSLVLVVSPTDMANMVSPGIDCEPRILHR